MPSYMTYIVEGIKGYKKRGEKILYLIKWKGFPDSESDNTCEPEENLSCPTFHSIFPEGICMPIDF